MTVNVSQMYFVCIKVLCFECFAQFALTNVCPHEVKVTIRTLKDKIELK